MTEELAVVEEEVEDLGLGDDLFESVPPAVMLAVLKQKLTLWTNTVFDAKLDVQVARVIGDKALEKRSTDHLKNTLKAVAYLTEELTKIIP